MLGDGSDTTATASPAGQAESRATEPVAGAMPSIFSMAEPVASTPEVTPPLAVVAAEPIETIMAVSGISPDEAAAATLTPPAPPVGGDVAVQDESLQSAAIAASEESAAAPAGPDARDYGATDNPGRIVLEATGKNWIQVVDRTNRAIFTRMLEAGDRYLVPDQPDLSLTTGKAGALIVTVDGKRLNALGALGAVRRGVPLDAGSLLREPGPAIAAGD
jgi:cytoskeleton protein RodZ